MLYKSLQDTNDKIITQSIAWSDLSCMSHRTLLQFTPIWRDTENLKFGA